MTYELECQIEELRAEPRNAVYKDECEWIHEELASAERQLKRKKLHTMRWFSLSRPSRRLPLYRVIAAAAKLPILRRRKSPDNKCRFNWEFCESDGEGGPWRSRNVFISPKQVDGWLATG